MTGIRVTLNSDVSSKLTAARAFFLLLFLMLIQTSVSPQALKAEGAGGNSADGRLAFGFMAHVPGVGESPGGEFSLHYGSSIDPDRNFLGYYGRLVVGIADGNGEGFGSAGLAIRGVQTGTTLEGGVVTGYFDGERFGVGGEGALFQEVFNSHLELGGVARVLAESGGTEKEALFGVRFRFG